MTTKEKLISRLQQWKFVQAMQYADTVSADLRQVLVRLSDLWGDSGHPPGGVFEDLIDYIVIKLIQDITAIPE